MLFSLPIIASILAATAHGCTDPDLQKRADGVAEWGYGPENGPLLWYAMDRVANKACGQGKNQTPIDITGNSTRTQSSSDYVLKYCKIKNVPYLNTHHTAQVQVDGVTDSTNTLTFANKTYNLLQFHFHVPSEHRINGEYFPMEVHFVHRSADGALAVVGYAIQVGRTNHPLLGAVLGKIKQVAETDAKSTLASLDLSTITTNFAKNNVFRYSGSLTTPPCTEGIEWIVSTEAITIDVPTFNEVKKVLKFNARNTQSDPGRDNVIGLVQ
ncbi:hypothetical protein HYALB_00013869 [Hymenoscyphus albidus]|uniref:Carbonic anhydrase n=1 Tax=Hymenoscyphus albidus TaxID=595503 RepID=A0A9N9LZ22_9HELO|nr:hypothetical protein HYALB_00013869 [Hymenoscyphus albidus]